jgi:hypothetical protein
MIQYDYGIGGLYTDLEKAKNELKMIYNRLPDYKIYGYRINVYDLVEDEYVITNVSYTYSFDIFYKNVFN